MACSKVNFIFLLHTEQTPSILIIVQRDATQSSLFILLKIHSTCFGYQPHPSSAVHKTVTTAPGTGHTAKYKGILPERYIIYLVTRNSVVVVKYRYTLQYDQYRRL